MKFLGFSLSDYGWLLQIANILLLAVGSWGALYMRHKFVAQAAFDEAEARIVKLEISHTIDAEKIPKKKELAELELRILAVEAGDKLSEERMKSLATKDDVNQVLTKMADQNGDRKALAEKVTGLQEAIQKMNAPIETIYKYLLRRQDWEKS